MEDSERSTGGKSSDNDPEQEESSSRRGSPSIGQKSEKSLSSRRGESHTSDREEAVPQKRSSSTLQRSVSSKEYEYEHRRSTNITSKKGESRTSAISLNQLSDARGVDLVSNGPPSVEQSSKKSVSSRAGESHKSFSQPSEKSLRIIQQQPGGSSSISKFPKDKEQTDDLPQNCSYETKRLDWKKVYSPSGGGQGELVLLKDQRCETDFTYTRGSMETTGDINVSDTDIISHGLKIMLKTQDESMREIKLPNLSKVLNLMQLTPEELAAVQAWLDQKCELSLQYEKEIHALLAFVKKILTEVKLLRKNINIYRQRGLQLENELALHPSAEVLADLYKESERLKKEILTLDQRHGVIVRSKEELRRSVQIEIENCHKTGNSISLQIQNLKYENKTLHHLLEVFTNEAREVSNNLLKRFEASLKTVKKLNGFLLRARALLEKKNVQTEEVELHLEDQDRLTKDIVDSIDLIQEHISDLRSDVDNMQKKSGALTSHAVNIRNEIRELLGNFNSISSELTNEGQLETEKRKNMTQVKEILDSLDTQKKNVKKLEKDITKLEKHIQSSETKERKDGVEIVGSSEKEYADEQQSWDDKMIRIRSYFEEMHEVITTVREEEAEKKAAIKDADKKDTIGEAPPQFGEETIRLSGRFICSDATAGEVVTRSGVCNIAEINIPKDSKIRSKDARDYGRGLKSAFAVGLQDLPSVPESPKSQLHGIYTKYNLKDAEEGKGPSSE